MLLLIGDGSSTNTQGNAKQFKLSRLYTLPFDDGDTVLSAFFVFIMSVSSHPYLYPNYTVGYEVDVLSELICTFLNTHCLNVTCPDSGWTTMYVAPMFV